MSIEIDFHDEDTLMIRVSGDLTHKESLTIRKMLDDMNGLDKCNKVILNLEGVGYVDSSGLAVIVSISKSMNSRGRQIIIRGSPAGIGAAITDVISREQRFGQLSGLVLIILPIFLTLCVSILAPQYGIKHPVVFTLISAYLISLAGSYVYFNWK